MRDITAIARDIVDFHLPGDNLTVVSRAILATLKQLSLDFSINVLTEEFTVNSNMTISMPKHCLFVTKVGVMTDNGCLLALGRNEFIRKALPSTQCDPQVEPISTNPNLGLSYPFYNYRGKGEIYGLVENSFPQGFYRYNTDKNRIELESGIYSNPGDSLWVEYQTSLSEAKITLIPEDYEQYIIHWTLHNLLLTRNPNAALLNKKAAAHARYLIQRARRPGPRDIVAALSGYHSAAK